MLWPSHRHIAANIAGCHCAFFSLHDEAQMTCLESLAPASGAHPPVAFPQCAAGPQPVGDQAMVGVVRVAGNQPIWEGLPGCAGRLIEKL